MRERERERERANLSEEIWKVHVYNTEGECVIFNISLAATHAMLEKMFFYYFYFILLFFNFFLRVSTYSVNY